MKMLLKDRENEACSRCSRARNSYVDSPETCKTQEKSQGPIAVKVLKNAQKVAKSCSVKTRYINKKH